MSSRCYDLGMPTEIAEYIDSILEHARDTGSQVHFLVDCGRVMGILEILDALDLIEAEDYQEYIAQIRNLMDQIELGVIEFNAEVLTS